MSLVNKSLIDELPEVINRPSAWIGYEMARTPECWMYHLTPTDIADLERATRHYLKLNKKLGQLTKADFPLPHFATHLAGLKQKLLTGEGFELIRGFPVANHSREFVATVFCGIGSHLGSARSQNAAGHLLGHVRDVGLDPQAVTTRIYQTSARQTFHTDSTDVVGLLCLCPAKTGGESLLVSAESIYNLMRQERPDLLPYMFDVVATDRRGEVPAGEKPYFEIPVLSWFQGYLTVQYQRQYINSAQRFPDAPRLSRQHVEAFDYFDGLANDSQLHLSMSLEPGDMQFVYNHSQLHDRTSFSDWPDLSRRRHLLRLWLSVTGDRPLPDCFKPRYGTIEIGNRGGIFTQHTRLQAPLD